VVYKASFVVSSSLFGHSFFRFRTPAHFHFHNPPPHTTPAKMSDMGRQSMTDKAGAALKPDSQKVRIHFRSLIITWY
jgi:hypothetical protein